MRQWCVGRSIITGWVVRSVDFGIVFGGIVTDTHFERKNSKKSQKTNKTDYAYSDFGRKSNSHSEGRPTDYAIGQRLKSKRLENFRVKIVCPSNFFYHQHINSWPTSVSNILHRVRSRVCPLRLKHRGWASAYVKCVKNGDIKSY